ncbi:phorbol esters/diacylglycerol binding domain (C1 domain) domain-containing protein [Cordyceps javanica]|nr:phorbol esters/diacylglycerol binding domain (C1 domain) domain-containing protein [Cordyceps javanica]
MLKSGHQAGRNGLACLRCQKECHVTLLCWKRVWTMSPNLNKAGSHFLGQVTRQGRRREGGRPIGR